MVKAIIDINDSTNRILNIIKAEFGLKDKSKAIEAMAIEYEELVFERSIKPSYLKRLKAIQKEGTTRFSSVDELRKYLKKSA